MMPAPIETVVIVGGGTAGWMTAAALAHLMRASGVSVRLVESDEIGTVGVGEATIPSIRDFNSLLGIDEDEMIRQTQGSFKLGIEFADWVRPGHRYFHPFGTHGRNTKTLRFHQLWLKLLHDGNVPDGIDDEGGIGLYNAASLAARMGRFAKPHTDPGHPLSTLNYAYHFDAALYARYLRRWSEARGVERIEGRIVEVDRDGESGSVRAVRLSSGTEVTGDLFVDCSGFRSLLLGETLGVPFIDWSALLPADRAVALPCGSVGPLLPYTRSTADAAGWRWRIPLQHRTGNGYVYSSDELDDQAALDRLLETIDGPPLGEPRFLRFKAGHRRCLWSYNVVAIGLSGGFLEPLESTSIHLIQTGISRLMLLFPNRESGEHERAEFNRQSVVEYEQIRDFLILHYIATERTDTSFWRRCRTLALPESLQHRIALFKSSGRIFRHSDELFTEDSWLAVMLGQGMVPVGHDRSADGIAPDRLRQQMAGLRDAMRRAVEPLPQHEDFIARHCRAEST
jgi:tryptophan halogenase